MKTLIKNSLFISAARFFNRGLGLISTLIVARILSPDDYGVIAACMLVQDLGRRFSQLGVNQNLISSKDASQELQDSLFAQRIMVSAIISAIIFLIAPYVSVWLHDPRITNVLRILCWIFFISSLTNFNCLVEMKRNNFKPELMTQTSAKIFRVIVTIVCAYLFRNYWALVAGIITSYIIQFLASYLVVKPYFIKSISFKRIMSNLSYSKWFLGREFIDYFNAKLAQIIAGMYFSTSLLGYLSVGRDLCLMLSLEVSAALDKSNLSYLSDLLKSNDRAELKETLINNVKQVFFFKSVIVVPFYLSVLAHSELFIKIVLGEGWLEMAPYCQIFACFSILLSYNMTFSTIFDSLRKPYIIMVASIVDFIVMFGFLIPAVKLNDPMLLVMCTIVGALINSVWYLYNLRLATKIRLGEILVSLKSTMFIIILSVLSMLMTVNLSINEFLQVFAYLLLHLVSLVVVAKVCNEEYQLEMFYSLKSKLTGG